MNSYQQLFAAVSDHVECFCTDLTKHDRQAIEAYPTLPYLHWARSCGTTLLFLPPIDDDSWPKYGERVKYLFGSADRDHVLDQKIVVAKYHTIKSNSPESFRCHHFDGSRLRAITVDAAVVVAERYAVKIRETWRIERMKNENPAEYRRWRERSEAGEMRVAEFI